MSEGHYSVIYTTKALNDLDEIFLYIMFQLKNQSAALKQVGRIYDMICSLDFMPARFARIDWEPWKSMDMHKISVDNYVIFYTIDENEKTVSVIRVVYGGRDLKSIFDPK